MIIYIWKKTLYRLKLPIAIKLLYKQFRASNKYVSLYIFWVYILVKIVSKIADNLPNLGF